MFGNFSNQEMASFQENVKKLDEMLKSARYQSTGSIVLDQDSSGNLVPTICSIEEYQASGKNGFIIEASVDGKGLLTHLSILNLDAVLMKSFNPFIAGVFDLIKKSFKENFEVDLPEEAVTTLRHFIQEKYEDKFAKFASS